MTASLRSAVDPARPGRLLFVAAVWGWQAATKPFPSSEPLPLCVDRTVNTGDAGLPRRGRGQRLQRQQPQRPGRRDDGAARGAGFVGADSDNAPAKINGVQIWSDEPRNPAVRLVARQFKAAKIVSGEELGRGVVVVVGESFKALRPKEIESVTAVETSSFCSPPDSE